MCSFYSVIDMGKHKLFCINALSLMSAAGVCGSPNNREVNRMSEEKIINWVNVDQVNEIIDEKPSFPVLPITDVCT